jgi:hypothetical protein
MTASAFEQYGNSWMPVEAVVYWNLYRGGTKYLAKWHVRIADAQLAPDFDALRSFVPDDIAEGARVAMGGDLYEWRNGKPVPVIKKQTIQRRR